MVGNQLNWIQFSEIEPGGMYLVFISDNMDVPTAWKVGGRQLTQWLLLELEAETIQEAEDKNRESRFHPFIQVISISQSL